MYIYFFCSFSFYGAVFSCSPFLYRFWCLCFHLLFFQLLYLKTLHILISAIASYYFTSFYTSTQNLHRNKSKIYDPCNWVEMQTPTWSPFSDKGLNPMFAASIRSDAVLYGIQSLSANDPGFEENSLVGGRQREQNVGLAAWKERNEGAGWEKGCGFWCRGFNCFGIRSIGSYRIELKKIYMWSLILS